MKRYLGALILLTSFYLGSAPTGAKASSMEFEFTQFALETNVIAIGGFSFNDKGVKIPIDHKEAKELFISTLREVIIDKIGIQFMSLDDYHEKVFSQENPNRRDVVLVSARLFAYAGKDFSPALDHDLAMLELIFKKHQKFSSHGMIQERYIYEDKPELFVLSYDKEAFRAQLREKLTYLFKKQLTPIACFGSENKPILS